MTVLIWSPHFALHLRAVLSLAHLSISVRLLVEQIILTLFDFYYSLLFVCASIGKVNLAHCATRLQYCWLFVSMTVTLLVFFVRLL